MFEYLLGDADPQHRRFGRASEWAFGRAGRDEGAPVLALWQPTKEG